MDDLTITTSSSKISGWTDIRLTRGIERCPSDFEIGMTEKFPGQTTGVVVQPGDACTVSIGSDVVVTGYVDRYSPSIAASAHAIRMTGRGKCQDLVDCSAEWPSCLIVKSSILDIATKLSAPYGITVTAGVDAGAVIDTMMVLIGETAYEIIERVCRWKGLLCYETSDGNLRLDNTGTTSASGGIVQGTNVQAATVIFGIDERYSEITGFLQSVDVYEDSGKYFYHKSATDEQVLRNRKLYIVVEAPAGGLDIVQKRVTWEVNRRKARGFQVRATVDSWRDSAGALWQPNTLAQISLPALKLPSLQWLIGEVTYSRNGQTGTTCDLLLMPPDAFKPEPFILHPTDSDVKGPGR
jgi:prophage tail gpP-like protein